VKDVKHVKELFKTLQKGFREEQIFTIFTFFTVKSSFRDE